MWIIFLNGTEYKKNLEIFQIFLEADFLENIGHIHISVGNFAGNTHFFAGFAHHFESFFVVNPSSAHQNRGISRE